MTDGSVAALAALDSLDASSLTTYSCLVASQHSEDDSDWKVNRHGSTWDASALLRVAAATDDADHARSASVSAPAFDAVSAAAAEDEAVAEEAVAVATAAFVPPNVEDASSREALAGTDFSEPQVAPRLA